MEIMSPGHKDWKKFYALLEGPEGCDFKEDESGEVTWKCKGGMNKTKAKRILRYFFPSCDVAESVKLFDEHGGHCDCEILFNVEDSYNAAK